jgi:lysophospholipase L1-like esterase
MRRIEHLLARLFLLLVVSSACFAVLELAARFYLSHVASESAFLRYASLDQVRGRAHEFAYSPHRYIGFIPTPSYRRGANRHNAQGYRGDEIAQPKPVGEFRIACLGGSTTYSTEIDDWRLAYPAQLERILRQEHGRERVRVINAGASSWSSWESLVDLEFRLLDLEPDVIVVYHGINDVHPRLVWPPEVYRGDNSGRRAAARDGLFMPSILQHSTLLRIPLIRFGLSRPHADLDLTLGGAAPTYYADEFERQVRQGIYPRGIFAQASARRMLEANPPIYYRRNLESTIAIARSRGIAVVLATFAYSPQFADEPRVASAEYRSAYAETNDVTRAVAREQGVHLFDFAERFPQDRKYFADGRHVNVEGAALKADLFARFLIENGLVPPAGDAAANPRS